jgi:hypothetical protein
MLEIDKELPSGDRPCMQQKASEIQIGGDHYKKGGIMPTEYAFRNKLQFAEGNVIKYVTRHRHKNGAEDLKKARHYIDLILEFEYGITGNEHSAD